MSRYEQPDYEVVSSADGYEIRRYQSYLAAETTIEGEFGTTGNEAFRRLAGFIFGRNSDGRKMNMTVPVTQVPTAGGGQRYRFVMERAFTEETLPRPVDPTVAIVRVPGAHYAARPYRGGRGEARYVKEVAALKSALERDGITVTGPGEAAVYDGPATPPFLRRNEVLVPVEWSL